MALRRLDSHYGLSADLLKATEYISVAFSFKKISCMLANPVTHDFIATLMLFNHVCTSEAMKRNIYSDLRDLFQNRFLRHQDYFKQDLLLVSSYNFILKIIDFLDSGVYNLSEEQKS